ncbi:MULTISPECIES: integrase arm-type DNA-binding domain-containing protein [unclassified Novosphingobium]|uniref:tyrosine-type recombinase/integrase n=1 Tax=unclassified Novosphingobium TaxID=2644732 RepID=UPI000D2FBE8E|nr:MULTISPECIES: integrase arm-type DNA-binding domain-containing protein [unclassified Novosphingobium]
MLNDTKIRKAALADKDYKLADEKGLYLLVRPTGGKLWRLKYRIAGKEKLLALGSYPDISLATARELRDEARKKIATGIDPMQEKRQAAQAEKAKVAHTFESVAREWHGLNKDRWVPVHQNDVIHSLERDVFPKLGPMPIADITAGDVLDVLRKVERRGSIETAKRLRQRISGVFVLAISQHLAKDNPAAMLEHALLPKKKAKKQPAVVDLTELRKLLTVTEASGAYPVTLLASRFLALTAQRPGTVRRAEWADMRGIDWDSDDAAPDAIWHIPAEQMKLSAERKDEAEFDHIVPLAPQAVDVLRAARVLSGRGALVFPGQRHAHIPLSENGIGYLYNRAGWHRKHVPHGWRAAFSTIMNERAKEAGIADDRAVIDLMLAHMPANKVESAYNRAQFMPRRRAIAIEWADLLMEGMAPASDLLPGRRRR